MTRDNIISLVKTKLDELTPFSEGLIVSTANSLTKPIEAHIDKFLDNESIEELLKQAPLQLLPVTVFPDSNITVTNNIATIVIPTDYIKVGIIKFALWERPVTEAILEQDSDARLQFNEYTRAKYSKPVVVFSNESDSKKLKCYSTPDKINATATYVKKLALTDIPDILIPAFTWLVASKVYFSLNMLKEYEQCDALFKNSLIISGGV